MAKISAEDTDAVLRDVVRLFDAAQREMTSCCSDATAKECEALTLLGHAAPLNVRDFAERMGLEKTWASRLLTRLDRRGFLERSSNPDDARSTMIKLSASGRAEFRRLKGALNEHAGNVMQCVPAGKRTEVDSSLRILRDALARCLEKGGKSTGS